MRATKKKYVLRAIARADSSSVTIVLTTVDVHTAAFPQHLSTYQ